MGRRNSVEIAIFSDCKDWRQNRIERHLPAIAAPTRNRFGETGGDADRLLVARTQSLKIVDGSLRDKKYLILDSDYFLLWYSAIARSRSFSSSQGSRHISLSAARCLSAPARSPVMRYASPMYSCAPRWRGSSSMARL
jgi:hypothetical protein